MADIEISEELANKLTPLSIQMGSLARVFDLPVNTITEAAVHPDDIFCVTLVDNKLEIRNINITLGYEVYDEHFNLIYSLPTLSDTTFGEAQEDIQFISRLFIGEIAYLVFQENDGTQRVILIIRV